MEAYRTTLCMRFFFKFFWQVSKEIDASQEPLLELNEASPLRATQAFAPRQDGMGAVRPHVSADVHTTGEAQFTDDITTPTGTLHMAFVHATRVGARVTSIDTSLARQLLSLVEVIGTEHIPAGSDYRIGYVEYFGQPACAVVSTSADEARRAASLIKITYEEGEVYAKNRIITVEDAREANSYFNEKPFILSNVEPEVTDDMMFENCGHVVRGSVRMGAQEHFYLEPQSCLCVPGERGVMQIHSSTQNVTSVQGDVSLALRTPMHKVMVTVKRIGGGFGGKESAASLVAVPTAVAATVLKRPVKCTLERCEDMIVTGTRHPILVEYTMGTDQHNTKIQAYCADIYANAGYSLDLSIGVISRSLWSADNAYSVERMRVRGHLCRTNVQPATAFRGFGSPQAMFATETALQHLATETGLDANALRVNSFHAHATPVTHYGMEVKCAENMLRCWRQCVAMADFEAMSKSVEEFNSNNPYVKRGVAVIPTKFGIAFGKKSMNQAGALVHIYADGSVLLNHAGMEMGQGLHTKLAAVAAHALGVNVDQSLGLPQVHVENTSTDKVPNTSPTAASVGTDLIGPAVQDACAKLMENVKRYREADPDGGWEKWAPAAIDDRVCLSASGFSVLDTKLSDMVSGRPQKSEPFIYFVFGAACALVELDCLSGSHRVLSVHLCMDLGDSLNPAVDIGQIEGAFIQGYGLCTMEQVRVRPDGTWLSRGPGAYKIPTADDCPRVFHVQLLPRSGDQGGFKSSKAVGEPPLFLGASVHFALRQAVAAARGDGHWFDLPSPATCDRLAMACHFGCEGVQLTAKEVEPTEKPPWTVEL